MKVAMLAAGAGGMYCGSCLRDNRLAATLIAQGREVVLIPLYTPLRSDEADVSDGAVHYGGINVYLQQKWPFFRRLPAWMGRVLDSRAVLSRLASLAGDTQAEDLGAMTVSVLEGKTGLHHRQVERLIEALVNLRPDLVCLPNLMFVGLAREIKGALGVPVLCTLSGEDVFLDNLPAPYQSRALSLVRADSRHIDGFMAVSQYYARHAASHFGLPPERIDVVPLGVRTDDHRTAVDLPAEPFVIGYLARICPEKGLANLCEAFVRLRRSGRNCVLRVAGYLGPSHRPYLARLRGRLHEEGLGDAFDWVGEVDRAAKLDFLTSLHVVSVPTVYAEAKGLYVLEALACGVPFVQPRHGSFPELMEATGGGVLYDPRGGAQALADAIASLMDDASLRRRLGEIGRQAVHRSFTAAVMADRAWAVFERHGRVRSADRTPSSAGTNGPHSGPCMPR